MAKETLPEKQARIKNAALLNAEIFYHYELIARATGITDDTLKKYRDEDKEFSERLEQIRAQFLGKHIRRSKSEFVLERLAPEYFKQKTETDITSGGNAITPVLVKFIGEDDTKSTNNRNTD